MIRPSLFLLACLGALSAQSPEDLAALRDGVGSIARPGVPGPVVLFGPDAFAVARVQDGSTERAVVGASRWGGGRVVLFGHGGYLGRGSLQTGDTGQLLRNALGWAAEVEAPRVGVLRSRELAAWLREQGFAVELIAGPGAPLPAVDVLCGETLAWDDAAEREQIADFVTAGGGLVTAHLGWGWLQLNPGKVLAEHPLNQLLRPAGLGLGDGYLDAIPPLAAEDGPRLEACHAGRALALLEAWAEGQRAGEKQLEQAGSALLGALESLPEDSGWLWPELTSLLADTPPALPSEAAPLRWQKPLGRLAIYLRQRRWERDPTAIPAAPEADIFPGAVPADAPRVTRRLELDARPGGWLSTGLYAAPGEPVTVTLPAALHGAGLRLRIGCHSDRLWGKAAWKRAPEISASWPLRGERTGRASPFGGTIFIEAPQGMDGTIALTIAGAVEAPRYVLGETSDDDWATIRQRPGPWAEMVSGKIVLSVPSRVVRELDDPRGLMEFWDRVLDTYAVLGQRPLPKRPERIVCDAQISAGYMHSGYPIMTHMDVAEAMVSPALLTAGSSAGWGFWHELGHNHQKSDWTFGGTTEVTCNLFTLFVLEELHGVRPHELPRMVEQWPQVRAHLAAGAPFEQWKRKPFLALMMYVQIQQDFGWELFQQVFAEYRDLPNDQRPRTDDDKRDQWLVRLSKAAGRDFGPFFERWGVPVSERARAAVDGLEVWNPEPPVE